MSDLWSDRRETARQSVEPLAYRMRPRTLDEVVGQPHILGDGCLLPRMLRSGALTSLLLHGPPGVGKTTLAQVIAHHVHAAFVRENAAGVGVSRIREIMAAAARRVEENAGRTILFLDEIHRFSKSQQDVLLSDVERGLIVLIGATTENPLFAVNSALVSRSTCLRLEPLSEADIVLVLRRAISDVDRGFGTLDIRVDDDALALWARQSEGDARRALGALEVAVRSQHDQEPGANHANPADPADPADDPRPLTITLAVAQESIQRKALVYSSGGDAHYDCVSAMIKSVRGSDPDAAVYWLAHMLEAGEDPRFLARRLAILASEDIGNADPHAVVVAQSCWSLVERIGMPEARITLSQCAIYLALAPKSNAAYRAIDAALADVRVGAAIEVPLFLRDPHKAVSAGSPKEGVGYQYNHNQPANTSIGTITDQSCLGVEKHYYQPTDLGYEKTLRQRLAEIQKHRDARPPSK